MKLSKRAAGTETVLQNVQQVKNLITTSITGLTATMQQVQNGVRQMQDLMKEVQQLDVQVRSLQQAQKVQQDAAAQAQQAQQTTSTASLVLAKKKKAPEHPTPRDTEHNENLPEFWRSNLDYMGESPYMHMDEIEKITDEVPHGKKRKGD